MTQAALKFDTQDIVVEEVFPARAGDHLENADDRRTHRPLAGDEA